MTLARRWQIATAVVALFALVAVQARGVDRTPSRLRFTSFPDEIAGWQSRRVPVSNEALRVLKLTDFLSRNYYRPDGDGDVINAYVGYHARQRQGSNIHSPLHCLPGSGWSILESTRVSLPGRDDGTEINRLVVGSGTERRLVYYWYHERGRVVASEIGAMWLRVRDIALRNRSDAALVRFMTRDADPATEQALRAFVAEFTPALQPYVPG